MLIVKWHFRSSYFVVAPYLMIVLGVYTFLVCIYGFFISGSENRLLIAIYAAFLSIAFIAQLVSIFTALELRTVVAHDVGAIALNEDLKLYGVDSGVTAKWDDLQEDLSCCGGMNYGTGYSDWRNTPVGRNNSVPDSCCHNPETRDCGRNIFRQNENEIKNRYCINNCHRTQI